MPFGRACSACARVCARGSIDVVVYWYAYNLTLLFNDSYQIGCQHSCRQHLSLAGPPLACRTPSCPPAWDLVLHMKTLAGLPPTMLAGLLMANIACWLTSYYETRFCYTRACWRLACPRVFLATHRRPWPVGPTFKSIQFGICYPQYLLGSNRACRILIYGIDHTPSSSSGRHYLIDILSTHLCT